MKATSILKEEFQNKEHDNLLLDIYVDDALLSYQRGRYIAAIETYEELFGKEGQDAVSIFSAPGRSEIGGNHTDHQHGEVLAASINLDAIAIVKRTEENTVKVVSGNSGMITISLNNLAADPAEEGTTRSLIKGVIAGIQKRGFEIGGFQAYITSDVLIGAGLSSSAAFETLIGIIESGLYNDMKITPIDIAIIGQEAENVYFGKPCGLMDQMASSVGNLVHIDFADPADPVVEKVSYDLSGQGYSLCIVDTKGSHADLTADYAAIPVEMKAAAACFGKDFMGQVPRSELLAGLSKVREAAGDRAALRAIHFVEENERVKKEVSALKDGDFSTFLKTVKASGDSSFKFLQNVYTNSDVAHQNVSVALAASEAILDDAEVCRVHGGGFAGTIQAFVKDEHVTGYKNYMDLIFGDGSCSVLKIRKYGGMQVL
ncbi:MAG: galactokinase [Eubacterium sp.]|nr:galactokinase [Eubacterium sp.]